MMLLILVFSGTLLLTFAIMVAGTAPSREAKVLQRRVAAVASSHRGIAEAPLEASQLLRKEATSAFGWLDRYFNQYGRFQHLHRWISQTGLKTTAASIFVQSAACAAAGFFIVLFIAPMLVFEVAGAALLAALPWARIAWVRSRRIRAFNNALAQAIDMMGRSLRAGHSTAGAIEIVAKGAPEPAASEFAEVFRQQNFGLPLRDALLQMLDRVPSQDLRVLVTAILVQRDTGGNLVEILDRTVFVIRERQRIYGEIRVQTAQGRLTGWILTLLPVCMMVLINIIDPGYSKILLTNPTGHKLIYAGLILIALGAFFINQIINSIEV